MLAVEMFTDYIWPWCYLCTVRVNRLQTEFNIKLQIRHFPLHPETPAEGLSLAALFAGRNIDLEAVQIEMLYYPQEVLEDMGPTATIPYSHYWTFNHEENHDNFAGADHLDFEYQLKGMEGEPVSGPDSKYDIDDIVHRRTAHDVRMKEAISKLNWPLVHQFEAAPLRAGSVVLYSHNMFHHECIFYHYY